MMQKAAVIIRLRGFILDYFAGDTWVSDPQLATIFSLDKAVELVRSSCQSVGILSWEQGRLPEIFADYKKKEDFDQEYLSIAEVSRQLTMSYPTVYSRLRKLGIESVRAGREILIRKDDFLKLEEAFAENFSPYKSFNGEPYIAVPEVARLLGLPYFKVYTRIKKLGIQSVRVGQRIFIREKDIKELSYA